MGEWTFFSNYGHVLVCLAGNREARLRDVAEQVGITERAVQKIVRDLQSAGFITVSKRGRCNRYRINRRKSLRHGLESHCTVGKLLTLVAQRSEAEPGEAADPASPEANAASGTADAAAAPSAAQADPAPTARVETSAAQQPRDGDKPKDKRKKSTPAAGSREQGSLF